MASATRRNLGNLGLSRGGSAGADIYSVFSVPADYDFASAIGPVLGLGLAGLFPCRDAW